MQKLNILLLGKYIKEKTSKISIYDFLRKSHKITFFNEFEKINFKKYDLVISYGYGKILKKKQIKKLGSNIINLHIGYLPFARGIYPLLWSIVFLKPVGFSIHLISNNNIDDGPIFIRKKIIFKNTDNLQKIHYKCRKSLETYFFKNFKIILSYKKSKLIKLKNQKKYYFSRKLSERLLYKLPYKWSTTAKYLKENSSHLKKIYKCN